MTKNDPDISRRLFIKATGISAASVLLDATHTPAADPEPNMLQLWSCGGLAEAFIPANQAFESMHRNVKIAYTGAFAAALGKSLLGNAQTEVFAPRVVDLAKTLKAQGKLLWYKPLCFTRYVIAVPVGNPAGITSLKDLTHPGVRVVMSPEASPPGGKATIGILKKAGIFKAVSKNIVLNGDCVQRTAMSLIDGTADAAIVEQRITRLPAFSGKLETIPIEEAYIPPPPVTFTIGMMKWAKNTELANTFIDFILSEQGQNHFAQAGFIPANSNEGKRLTEKYGI